MTTDDGLDMVQVGGATISPDGSWVLFSKSELNWEENERETTWWRVSAEGGEPYRYIGEEGGGNFQFSPDGSKLAFTRSVDDESQLFLLPTTGGEAVQLSEHETSIGSYAWSEDGSKIFFVATEPRTEEEEKAREAGYDAIFVDEGPNGHQPYGGATPAATGAVQSSKLPSIAMRLSLPPTSSRVSVVDSTQSTDQPSLAPSWNAE